MVWFAMFHLSSWYIENYIFDGLVAFEGGLCVWVCACVRASLGIARPSWYVDEYYAAIRAWVPARVHSSVGVPLGSTLSSWWGKSSAAAFRTGFEQEVCLHVCRLDLCLQTFKRGPKCTGLGLSSLCFRVVFCE